MVRVDRGTVEDAREVGEARVPVVAVADDQRVEALAVDLPAAAVQPLGALDGVSKRMPSRSPNLSA